VANIVTLADVKTYCQIPAGDTTYDSILPWFIAAADKVIEFECDDILPTLYDERYDGGQETIFLRHCPIYEVSNVEEGWGWINYELDFIEVNSPAPVFSMFAYSIDSIANGEISRRSAGNVTIPFRPGDKNIRVTYSAGLEVIPGNIILAELQLVAFWFRNSELRSMALAGAEVQYDNMIGVAYTRDTAGGLENIYMGIPNGILELIKSHGKRPKFA
jgi:hypothetical protein